MQAKLGNLHLRPSFLHMQPGLGWVGLGWLRLVGVGAGVGWGRMVSVGWLFYDPQKPQRQ